MIKELPSRNPELPNLISSIKYREGQMRGFESIAVIPGLKGIKHGISMGPGSRNMAEKFEADQSIVIGRIEDFLADLCMEGLSESTLLITGKDDIVEVSQSDIRRNHLSRNDRADIEALVGGCAVMTSESVPLLVKPADCPVVILTGKEKEFVGLYHAGRDELNKNLTSKVIEKSCERFGLDSDKIVAGITPGIGKRHYVIKKEDIGIIDCNMWGKNAEENLDGIHLNLVGQLTSQLLASGVLGQNIFGYSGEVDTFDLSSQNPRIAFSHRYATSTNQPEKNG